MGSHPDPYRRNVTFCITLACTSPAVYKLTLCRTLLHSQTLAALVIPLWLQTFSELFDRESALPAVARWRPRGGHEARSRPRHCLAELRCRCAIADSGRGPRAISPCLDTSKHGIVDCILLLCRRSNAW